MASIADWASATKLAMSRPRTFTPTTARRWTLSRSTSLGPSSSAISARSFSGIGRPEGSVIRIEPIRSASLRQDSGSLTLKGCRAGSRTFIVSRFSSSKTVPTVMPPSAATASSTSDALMP